MRTPVGVCTEARKRRHHPSPSLRHFQPTCHFRRFVPFTKPFDIPGDENPRGGFTEARKRRHHPSPSLRHFQPTCHFRRFVPFTKPFDIPGDENPRGGLYRGAEAPTSPIPLSSSYGPPPRDTINFGPLRRSHHSCIRLSSYRACTALGLILTWLASHQLTPF